jgi:hypothetical protein
MAINLAGVAGFLAFSLAVARFKAGEAHHLAAAALACIALPIGLLEFLLLKTHRRGSTGLDFASPRPVAWGRSIVKLVGLTSTLAAVGAFYYVLPEYQGDFYAQYWAFLKIVGLALLLGGVPYFILVDRHMTESRDGYWHMGMLVLGQWRAVDRKVVQQHLLGWAVKAFFLALMFVYLTHDIEFLQTIELSLVFDSFRNFYDVAWRYLFAVDVAFVCCGYLLTLRVLDSHIRSTDATTLGWVAALVCYQPFWSFVQRTYLNYENGTSWGYWLEGYPALYAVWGTAILLVLCVYTAASVVFGLRFSNLTHRGIITNGPYRYTKHPAYVAKNITWWMIAMPFLSNTGVDGALRGCLLLLGLNLLYFLRARTEERHLSKDPVYVQYALAMNERSVFRWAGQMVPVLRYRPPEVAEVVVNPTESGRAVDRRRQAVGG